MQGELGLQEEHGAGGHLEHGGAPHHPSLHSQARLDRQSLTFMLNNTYSMFTRKLRVY